jgi:hypothetical protein
LLGVAPGGIHDGIVGLTKVQPDAIAKYLAVKRRFAVGKSDGESEHPRIEIARGNNVSNVQLRLGGKEGRRRRGIGSRVRHEMTSQ